MKKHFFKVFMLSLGLTGATSMFAASYMDTAAINLNLRNVTIEQAFKAIEEQSEFSFFYNEEEVNSDQRISIHVKDKGITEVLSQLLNRNDIAYKITDRHIVLYRKTNKAETNQSVRTSQKHITVKGVVTDENGLPIIGVTIITASKNGTTTDMDGNYTLEATEGELITFSYIGYSEQQVAAKSQLNIQLKPTSIGLDEVTVVAIGYGVSRKSDLTGSIASVSAKDFKQGVISSAEQLLQGKVAGLVVSQGGGDPTKSSSMRLRGGTSLSASNAPLVVVDGIPGVDLSTVQPNEILSMDVLKDASATAIYGSRGANGVIIVTTNREKKGRSIEYNGYVAIGKSANNLDVLTAGEWRQYVNDHNLTDAVDYGADTDWQKAIQRTAISHSHTLSFSSGGEDNGLRASVNYLRNEGIVKFSDLDRMSASLTAYQYGLNDRLKVELSLQANADKRHNVDNAIYSTIYNMNPTAPIYDENGNYLEQIGGRLTENNPVESHTERNDETTRKHLLGYGKVELSIIDGLKATTNLSYEYNSNQDYYYRPSYVYKVTDGGYAKRYNEEYTNKQLEVFLNYDKTFNKIHRVGAMVGYSYLDYSFETLKAERRKFDTDDFLWNNLGAGQDNRLEDVASSKSQAKLISFFARANYTFKDRYMLTATIRRDGSSRFGANHKWGTFPSVSAAWRVSEETFMEGLQSWLANLKLRAGYGLTGNQSGIGEYKSAMLMGTGGGAYFDSESNSWKQSYGVTQNPNPDLKWESTAQTNVGVDMFLFNRLNLTFDWYLKKTSDLLYTYQVPNPPYLYSNILANVGDLTNKGVELTLGANLINHKDFTWDANLTLAHNKQTVDKLSNQVYQTDRVLSGSLQGILGMSNRYSQVIEEGYPVGTFYGPHCEGIVDGKFVLANDGEDEILGNAQPKLTMGLSFNFTYKDFDLGISGYGMYGQKVLNVAGMERGYTAHMPNYNITSSFAESGISDENMPVYSDFWLENGSFFRLQSVTLGYTLPARLLKNFGVNRLRFYATGENLFVLTGYTGIDPEVGTSDLKEVGLDKGNIYPMPRTFSIGLNLSF